MAKYAVAIKTKTGYRVNSLHNKRKCAEAAAKKLTPNGIVRKRRD